MGLTLVAVLTAALLLPGIIATRILYQAGRTREAAPAIPPMTSPEGIGIIGASSVVIHLVYVAILAGVSRLPPVLPLPLADPYEPLFEMPPVGAPVELAFALFAGLVWLCLLASVLGFVAGRILLRWGAGEFFHGPLQEIITQGIGDDTFTVAYVLTKMEREGTIVGYRGTVARLLYDADRFPAKLLLKDAVVFTLDITAETPRRRERGTNIEWIALSADDWQNVAFRTLRVIED